METQNRNTSHGLAEDKERPEVSLILRIKLFLYKALLVYRMRTVFIHCVGLSHVLQDI